MYDKIKTFISKHKYIFTCIVIMAILCTIILFSSRKNILDDGGTADRIRNQLERIEEAKSDITGTVNTIESTAGKLEKGISGTENSIDNAQETSSKFDDIIGECESLFEQIRRQSTE